MSNGLRRYVIALSSALLVVVIVCCVIFLNWRPTVVLLVRHAERSTTATCVPTTVKTRQNLALLPAGVTRADVLKHVGGEDSISAIYASEFCRTQDTVRPLANELALGVTVVDQYEADGVTVNVDNLTGQIKSNHRGQVVLVAGHTNTLPPIIEELGGSITEIGEDEFDNLYVVIIPRFFGTTRVVRLKYGAAT